MIRANRAILKLCTSAFLFQFTGKTYTAGVEEVERDGVKLRVYGVAKTVADCFKHRNKISLDVALEALKEARARTWPCDSASHGQPGALPLLTDAANFVWRAGGVA